jgi:hypothetical protein
VYIDDCVKGTQKIMHSAITDPINLGSDELATINELGDVIEAAVGVDLEREYNLTKPRVGRPKLGQHEDFGRDQVGTANGVEGREGRDCRKD